MPIDDLVRLLRDHEVDLWCKRAAWLIALVNTVLVVFQLLGLLTQGGSAAALPLALLQTVLSYVVTTLWYFFVLYALGAITGHLVRS